MPITKPSDVKEIFPIDRRIVALLDYDTRSNSLVLKGFDSLFNRQEPRPEVCAALERILQADSPDPIPGASRLHIADSLRWLKRAGYLDLGLALAMAQEVSVKELS